MGMFNENGDLNLYSEGEDPKAAYYINWDKVKTVGDIKALLSPAITIVNCDYSNMTENEVKLVNNLLDKKILK
jgi:hypothetical protein